MRRVALSEALHHNYQRRLGSGVRALAHSSAAECVFVVNTVPVTSALRSEQCPDALSLSVSAPLEVEPSARSSLSLTLFRECAVSDPRRGRAAGP